MTTTHQGNERKSPDPTQNLGVLPAGLDMPHFEPSARSLMVVLGVSANVCCASQRERALTLCTLMQSRFAQISET